MRAMITLNSDNYRALAKQLYSIAKGDAHPPRQALHLPGVKNCDDYFLALLHLEEGDTFFSGSRFRDVDQWLSTAEESREEFRLSSSHFSASDAILYQVWEIFRRELSEKLGRFLKAGDGFPGEGGIISFIGGLARCLVIRYRGGGDSFRFQVMGVIPDPNDFWADSSTISASLRDEIKTIYNSGHRLTYHKGVLAYVGKRSHPGVFGPSIDTIVMSEVLTQLPRFQAGAYGAAIEIGSGSGLLAAVMLNQFPRISELSAVDINHFATKCTRKNVTLNFSPARHSKQPGLLFINEAFRVEAVKRPYDLIVCGPPYIPVPVPGEGIEDISADSVDYYQSIADISLMRLLCEEAPALLAPGGQLLLLTGSCAITQALKFIPKTCRVSRPLGAGGFQALFDIDAVISNQQWLSYLLESKALQRTGPFYYHQLHPLLIEPKGNS